MIDAIWLLPAVLFGMVVGAAAGVSFFKRGAELELERHFGKRE